MRYLKLFEDHSDEKSKEDKKKTKSSDWKKISKQMSDKAWKNMKKAPRFKDGDDERDTLEDR